MTVARGTTSRTTGAFMRRFACGSPLAGILAVYFLLCAGVLPWYLHRVAPDAVSYLTIARKYRAWEFSEAVNGYWSPLLSWLVAPLLCLGAPAEVTARCLQIVIGAGGLWAVWWLGKRMELPDAVRAWTTAGLVPAVAMYALTDTTPDLLVAVLLSVYIGVVIGADYPRSLWHGAACGLLGAFAYFAKAYAFPFFLAHYLAVSGYLFLRRRSSGESLRRLAAATAMGLVVFAVVAGVWVSLLSRKYSRITFGTTGSYQFSLRGQGHPTDVGGLYPPATRLAVSAWEDPSDLRIQPLPPRPIPPSTPKLEPAVKPNSEAAPKPKLEPPPTPKLEPPPKPQPAAGAEPLGKDAVDIRPFIHALNRLTHNGIRYTGTLFRLSPLSPLIVAGLLMACWTAPRGRVRDHGVILIGSMLLYSGGYLMIFITERFFWLITFLLSVSAGLVATTLPILRRDPWRTCWAVAVSLSLMLWPAWVLARLSHHVLEQTPAVAAHLKSMIPPGARIASDLEWGITNSIAYHLDARYYGLLRPDATVEEQDQQLREHRIRYLFLWGDPGGYPFLASCREVPVEQVAGARWPRVFKLPAARDRARSPQATPTVRP